MKNHANLILASVTGNYGAEIVSLFTCAVFIDVPKEIRMERVKDRSFQKFGNRMLPGGDLYEKEKRFFDMIEQRTGHETEDWMKSLCIPIIHVDGTKPIGYNTEKVIQLLIDTKM